jgi:hypothetical protein
LFDRYFQQCSGANAVVGRHAMTKKVLLIAYHFPPILGSSGVHRALSFARYLPEFGWTPLVLTVQPQAYPEQRVGLTEEVPAHLHVERAWALDTARHLSVGGRYPRAWATPDRWTSWRFDAVRRGKRLLREHDVSALWSSYPIGTAHAIGLALQRGSGKPWLADFRDPMAQHDYPSDPQLRQAYYALEKTTVAQAKLVTLTTPGAVTLYRARYAGAAERIHLLENGYDEALFSGAVAAPPLVPDKITVLHSGVVYPKERDPTHLFAALSFLAARHPDVADRVRFRFRAPGDTQFLLSLAQRFAVGHLIEVMPPVDYRNAINEMLSADALLILQASNCNAQIPGKLYEYLRARKPIIALTDPAGDTAWCLRKYGIDTQASLDAPEQIVALLSRLPSLLDRFDPSTAEEGIRHTSRRARTEQFAGLLEHMIS